MLPSEYLRIRARAICEGVEIPRPLDKDWLQYVELVRPRDEEWLDADAIFSDEQHVLRLLLAAAIADGSA